jgi:predicted thioredoxin/glutaredoxin
MQSAVSQSVPGLAAEVQFSMAVRGELTQHSDAERVIRTIKAEETGLAEYRTLPRRLRTSGLRRESWRFSRWKQGMRPMPMPACRGLDELSTPTFPSTAS